MIFIVIQNDLNELAHCVFYSYQNFGYTVELLSGTALGNVNLNINVLISNPIERPIPLERPLFWCKRGGLTRGVPLYYLLAENQYMILY